MWGPITVKRLQCCDWSNHKLIEGNFSKLTDSNQIFRIDFVSINYHLCGISCEIIVWKIFWSIWPYELTDYSTMGTARTKKDKVTDEEGNRRGVSMERSKAGTKERCPDCLSLPYQNTTLINIIWYYFTRYGKSTMKLN